MFPKELESILIIANEAVGNDFADKEPIIDFSDM